MHSRVPAALLSVVIAVGAGGCTSDDDPAADASPGATTTTATTDDGASDTPTEAPAVEPASGEKAVVGVTLSLRIPAEGDWSVDDSGGSLVANALIDDVGVTISGSDVLYDETSIDDAARTVLRTENMGGTDKYRRVENRIVAGVEGWVLEGKDENGRLTQFGTIHKGRIVRIYFVLRTGITKATGDALISSVLASVEWK